MSTENWDRLMRKVRAVGLFIAAAFILWRGFFFRETGRPSCLIVVMCFALGLLLVLAGVTLLGQSEESDMA